MENEYSLITWGRVFNPDNWFYNPAYVVNRVYYIVDGQGMYMEDIPLKKDFLYLFSANSDFKVKQDEAHPIDHVYFDFVTYRKLLDTDYIEIDISKDIRLKSLIDAITIDFCNDKNQFIAKSYLEIIMYYLTAYLLPKENYSETVKKALECIHKTSPVDLSVNQIADHIHKNVNHMIRCFKKEIGITPHQYIAKWKIDIAISHLRQGKSGTEIAGQLGFDSLAAFSYFFKKETGQTITQCLETL